jgi:hypothetical protein
MKRNNYIQHLLIENRVLKANYNILYVKNAEQQEEINNYKDKIEKLYVKNANTILFLQEKNNHLNELIMEKNKHIRNIVYQKSFPVNSAPLFQLNESLQGSVPSPSESDLTFEY